jgi:hypothetical protein
MSNPVTGEYITLETRYRAYWEQALRERDGSVDRIQEMVETYWNGRSDFMRDLERLEHIRLTLSPPSAASRAREVEYDSLLEKVLPLNIHFDINTSEVIEELTPTLRDEARQFSLLTPAEEERYRRSTEDAWSGLSVVYTADRRRSLAEDLLQRHRLSRFVDSGVYRHYVSTTNRQTRRPSLVSPFPASWVEWR